jgi:hypothetical protein
MGAPKSGSVELKPRRGHFLRCAPRGSGAPILVFQLDLTVSTYRAVIDSHTALPPMILPARFAMSTIVRNCGHQNRLFPEKSRKTLQIEKTACGSRFESGRLYGPSGRQFAGSRVPLVIFARFTSTRSSGPTPRRIFSSRFVQCCWASRQPRRISSCVGVSSCPSLILSPDWQSARPLVN